MKVLSVVFFRQIFEATFRTQAVPAGVDLGLGWNLIDVRIIFSMIV